jgi:hypothetical protein
MPGQPSKAPWFIYIMTTVASLLKRLDSVDINAQSKKAIEATDHALIDLNVEQMNAGKRSDGTDILPTYTDLTIQIKKQKGQPHDRVTLRDTGEFQSATYVRVEGDSYTVGSSNPKAAKLNKKYSTSQGNIHGLSAPYKKRYVKEDLRPEFVGNIKGDLKL